ncbi:MAG: radical SAM/SPASM domain-containing protein [Candidatus Helarchaeota archaeon]
MSDFPKILQIEPTTYCNFNCKMCVRNVWSEKFNNFPIDDFKIIAKKYFPKLERVIFMGIGEVLLHPSFPEFIEISSRYLPSNGKIEFSTNGSLLTSNLTDEIIEKGRRKLDRIIVSVESPYLFKLQKIRPEANKNLFKNIKYLGELCKGNILSTLAIESVIMKSTLYDLLDLIHFCNDIGANALYITHLLPHTIDLISETLYTIVSEESWNLGKKFIDEILYKLRKYIISRSIGPAYGEFNENKILFADDILKLLNFYREKSFSSDLSINLDQILQCFQKLDILNDTNRIFKKALELAHYLNIKLELPSIFPSYKNRICPYVERDATVINVKGEVVPCFNYIHNSISFIDKNMKKDQLITYGNIFEQDLSEIWRSKNYQTLRKRLKNPNFSNNIPWCGDCPYFTANCFYIKSNLSDCYGNTPGCNECLYSCNLIKCIFDA